MKSWNWPGRVRFLGPVVMGSEWSLEGKQKERSLGGGEGKVKKEEEWTFQQWITTGWTVTITKYSVVDLSWLVRRNQSNQIRRENGGEIK